MPRVYKRKSDRGKWSEDNMREAIREVLTGNMGYVRSSRKYNVPPSTLVCRVLKARKENSSPSVAAKKGSLGRYKSTFSAPQEEALKNFIATVEATSRLTRIDFRRLVFHFAEKNGIPHTFNKEKGLAGKEWLHNFLTRHPDVSFRKSTQTEISSKIDEFLDELPIVKLESFQTSESTECERKPSYFSGSPTISNRFDSEHSNSNSSESFCDIPARNDEIDGASIIQNPEAKESEHSGRTNSNDIAEEIKNKDFEICLKKLEEHLSDESHIFANLVASQMRFMSVDKRRRFKMSVQKLLLDFL